jgi:hypothetical protein
MDLTNPAALWLLPVCVLPLLLSRRVPATRLIVSNAYLWNEAVRRSGGPPALRRVRLTPLAALQMACIAAIVLALAGPVISWRGGRTAIVFDVSGSMSARDGGALRVDEARARLRSILNGLPRLARVQLIRAAASPRLEGEWPASDPRLALAIDSLQPTGGNADLPAAMAIAAASGDIDNIIVVSDQDVGTSGGALPAVQLVRVGGAAENAAITRVAVRRNELGGREGRILVAVRTHGTKPREAGVEIESDGRIVHRERVRLEAAGSHAVEVEVSDLGRFVTARIDGGDALALDDVRSTAVPGPAPIRVVLIGPRGSFLERALAVNPSVSLRRYDSPAGLQESAATDVDVLVCDRCGGDPRLAATPSLVVTDGAGGRTHDFVRVAAPAHPLAASVEPGDVPAAVALASRIGAGADVVLRVGGLPAVTAFETDGVRRAEVHFDLTDAGFALSPAFPVLVANAISWLAAGSTPPPDLTAGEPLTFTPAAADNSAVRVTGPDGRRRDVRRTGSRLIVGDTDVPGRYTIHVDGAAHVVAVNADARTESDLSVPQSPAGNPIAPSSPSLRAPLAIARWLVLLAFALLALEWRLRLQGGQ